MLGRWDRQTGLACLIGFGDDFAEQRVTAFKGEMMATALVPWLRRAV
jgi:hypothetical protein